MIDLRSRRRDILRRHIFYLYGCGGLLRARVFHHDRLGDAVVDAAVVEVDAVLDEAESAFESGGTVAEGALHGLPERDLSMRELDGAYAQQALSGS